MRTLAHVSLGSCFASFQSEYLSPVRRLRWASCRLGAGLLAGRNLQRLADDRQAFLATNGRIWPTAARPNPPSTAAALPCQPANNRSWALSRLGGLLSIFPSCAGGVVVVIGAVAATGRGRPIKPRRLPAMDKRLNRWIIRLILLCLKTALSPCALCESP